MDAESDTEELSSAHPATPVEALYSYLPCSDRFGLQVLRSSVIKYELENVFKMTNFLRRQIFVPRYHLRQNRRAKIILRNLESVTGRLNPKLVKLSDEYARDVLGWHIYAPWLYVYSAIAGDFKEGWIPDNYYGKIVVPAINGKYRGLSSRKSRTKQLFKKSISPDIAYCVNGLFLGKNCEALNETEVKDILFRNGEVIVYKLERSSQGKGIYFFDSKAFDTQKIKALGDGVFQSYIEQHQFFDRYMPSSVATLRVTTIIDNYGNCAARASYLRIGRSEDTHIKSLSHIRIPVSLKTGELDARGYLPNWLTIDKHPDTGVAFRGARIPDFDNCILVASDLHRLIPYVRSVGWDMVVDKDNNIKIMEWNSGHNDIKFSEATQGPCFQDLGWEKLWQQ